MSKQEWNLITRANVIEAIHSFLSDNPDYPAPRNTFLLFEGKKLPAKHIRGMAYKVAFGKEISKEDYSGGMETVRFFKKLGFDVLHVGKEDVAFEKPAMKKEETPAKIKCGSAHKAKPKKKIESNKISIPTKGVIEQKNELQLLLNKMFDGDIVCEKTFPWMKTPDTLDEEYEQLYTVLVNYRGDSSFAKKNVLLRCDFVCESEKLIIEYDERQHFSEARRLSLFSYGEVPLYFDRNLWIQACSDIQAKDNQPANRDEIRAYYDSVRDIEASKHGYRLVRIMHGQIDFQGNDAKSQLENLLTNEIYLTKNDISDNNRQSSIKVGMYLQTNELKNEESFRNAVELVKKSDMDIWVLPEVCYVPFEDRIFNADLCVQEDLDMIFDSCLKLSQDIGKAVVVSSVDSFGSPFSVFANYYNEPGDSKCNLYVKHTMTQSSVFEFSNYRENWREWFPVIEFKGFRIGLSICYDCNHAIFSRMYGLQDVDLILNSTGGDVIYDKWYKYNKARAIENSCYNLITMGGDGTVSNPHCYVFGFNRHGGEIHPENICSGSRRLNSPGEIYVYKLSKYENSSATEETSLLQKETINKKSHMDIPAGNFQRLLDRAKKIKDNLFLLKTREHSIFVCLVEGMDILKPEKVLPLLYAAEIKGYENCRYIILNRHGYIGEELFNTKLSLILKVRAMENYCAIVLESENINHCYQCGMNRTAQVVKSMNGLYGIDLNRATGPDAIWKDKNGMKESWRPNFEWLILQCERETMADS